MGATVATEEEIEGIRQAAVQQYIDNDEMKYWDQAVRDRDRKQLENVQKAATTWSALLAAVLGVLSTAAFAGGITSLDKLGEPWALIAKVATLVAALFLLISILRASEASGTTKTGLQPHESWNDMQAKAPGRAKYAADKLDAAKFWGGFAAVIILVGSTVAFVAGEKEAAPSTPPKVIAVIGGIAVCGELKADGSSLEVDGETLTGVESITVVTACP